jgi:hypothetical protein
MSKQSKKKKLPSFADLYDAAFDKYRDVVIDPDICDCTVEDAATIFHIDEAQAVWECNCDTCNAWRIPEIPNAGTTEMVKTNQSEKRAEFDLAFERFKIAALKLYGKNSIWELEMMIDQWHDNAEDGTYDE